MYYTLERFEEGHAVLIGDDKKSFCVPSVTLEISKIGSVFSSDDGKTFLFLEKETDKRKNHAATLHRKLFGSAEKNR